ncbi:MAG: MotA/TolQ/ExbB proton channel family protein [Chlamydiae bacterium]|nr:MotA/TolQ/ExbB proton channel family protein [Chlamydiota bacterium]
MFLIAANPFISAYLQSDLFGKMIFWGLIALSGISWWVIAYKSWVLYQMRRLSSDFKTLFSEKDPLGLQFHKRLDGKLVEVPHPFFSIYKAMKQQALQIMSRNQFYAPMQEVHLTEADLGLIESQVFTAMTSETKHLEKHLFILSTAVTLAPFLGLLGTVWGILMTFSQLQEKSLGAMNNAAMLSGLSLALATTVLGLLVAIPALIGYNYLKSVGKDYRRDLENFAHILLSATELHYRKPHEKTAPSTS